MARKIKEKEEKKSRKQKAKESAKKLRIEVRKAVSTAILAAFGFLIALVWRDVIQGWVNTISADSPVQGQLVSALIVTFICVIGILIITKFLVSKE